MLIHRTAEAQIVRRVLRNRIVAVSDLWKRHNHPMLVLCLAPLQLAFTVAIFQRKRIHDHSINFICNIESSREQFVGMPCEILPASTRPLSPNDRNQSSGPSPHILRRVIQTFSVDDFSSAGTFMALSKSLDFPGRPMAVVSYPCASRYSRNWVVEIQVSVHKGGRDSHEDK